MVSKQLITQFANDTFTPLANGECVSCMFVAGGGKRTILNYLLSEKSILSSIFGDIYQKTLFVYVDPNEVLDVSTEAYLDLILHCLTSTMKEHGITVMSEATHSNPLIHIKKNLENLALNDWRVVFILNDFEFTVSLPSSIYLNLESIMSVDKSKIVYLFLSTLNLFSEQVMKHFHNLKYAISRNVLYFPLLSEEDADEIIAETSEKLKLTISNSVIKALFMSCGGHPQLLKYALHHLESLGVFELNDARKVTMQLKKGSQLKIVCADIWNFLNEKEKEAIISIVTTGSVSSIKQEEVDYLLSLKLIYITLDKKYTVFGTLFEDFVKNKLPKHTLSYNPDSKKIFFGLTSCEEKFTDQEFKLLVYCITHENELITRDQVAEAIWGKHYLDKYSDWSIDKTVSILRKKLDILGFPSEQLVTLKKRGFSFSNPS